MPDFMSVAEVLAACGGRWKDSRTLSAATRRGDGPGGRIALSQNKAAYDRRSVEAWLAAEEQRRAQKLAAMQARAAHAREARASLRAAKGREADLLVEALAAVVTAAEAKESTR